MLKDLVLSSNTFNHQSLQQKTNNTNQEEEEAERRKKKKRKGTWKCVSEKQQR